MSAETKVRFDWRAHLEVHPAADLFPLMSESELKELAADIQKSGMKQIITIWVDQDEKQWLLDGRNRLDALSLLGYLAEDGNGSLKPAAVHPKHRYSVGYYLHSQGLDPYSLALSYNLHRRHLTAEQKRDVIAKLLKAQPETSDRIIGKAVNVDHKTVASVRADGEARGEFPHVEKRTDSKGRKQPAQRERKHTGRPLESIIKDIKDNLAEEDLATRAAFAAGYNPNVIREEETEQDRLIREHRQDQHAWLTANNGKKLTDGFWLTNPRTAEERAAGTPPRADDDHAADDTETSAAAKERIEHFRSAMILQADQAADLSGMFRASYQESPSSVTSETVEAVRRSHKEWADIAAMISALPLSGRAAA